MSIGQAQAFLDLGPALLLVEAQPGRAGSAQAVDPALGLAGAVGDLERLVPPPHRFLELPALEVELGQVGVGQSEFRARLQRL